MNVRDMGKLLLIVTVVINAGNQGEAVRVVTPGKTDAGKAGYRCFSGIMNF